MHRSSVTSRTPEVDHNCSASRDFTSSLTVTLEDVMQQLKQSGDLMQQLKQSSGVVDVRLGLTQESLTRMERTMGAIRTDVADLSASHQLLAEKVTALETRTGLAHSDPHGMREGRLALNSRLSDLTSRLSHIESSRAPLASMIPSDVRQLPVLLYLLLATTRALCS